MDEKFMEVYKSACERREEYPLFFRFFLKGFVDRDYMDDFESIGITTEDPSYPIGTQSFIGNCHWNADDVIKKFTENNSSTMNNILNSANIKIEEVISIEDEGVKKIVKTNKNTYSWTNKNKLLTPTIWHSNIENIRIQEYNYINYTSKCKQLNRIQKNKGGSCATAYLTTSLEFTSTNLIRVKN